VQGYPGIINIASMSQMVKNYEVRQTLGEGGMGTVFFAVDVQLHRDVALKCLRPEVASHPGILERFRQEARVQARLNHPNIAQIYEFFQYGPAYYLAMELIEGPTLARVVRTEGRLRFEKAAKYAIEALRGLENVHKQGIVHRDVKPANLMLNKAGEVKVTDFGIARLPRNNSSETRVGTIIGTFEYISPEAAQALEATPRSDLYSMGVTLFELLTGRVPFQSKDDGELLRMHVHAPRPSVRSIVKDIPAAVDEIVLKAMDRKPLRRFHSAAEMADALQKCLLEPIKRRDSPAPFLWRLWSSSAAEEGRRTDISATCHWVEDLMEQQRYREAESALEDAFRRNPDVHAFHDLRDRLRRARQQYDQTIARESERVQDLLKRGSPSQALQILESALGTFPRATVLLELERECRRQIDKSSTDVNEMAQIRGRVEELIGSLQFNQATDYVLQWLELHDNKIELNQLLAEITQAKREAEKRAETKRAVEAAIREARDLEASVSLDAARDRLTRNLEALGRDAALLQELERIDRTIEDARREASVVEAMAIASQLLEARKWREALALLDRTTEREGRDDRIEDLRSTTEAALREHEELIEQAMTEGRHLIRDRKWEAAILHLSSVVRSLPGEAPLESLMREAQQGLAQQRRDDTVARIKAEAEQFVRDLRFSDALRLLLDAVSQYPDDHTLGAALSQTIFERDAYLDREKVKAALGNASKLRAEGHFEQGIGSLREALREVPGSIDLRNALAKMEREWCEICRRNTIRELTELVNTSLANRRHEAALEGLARALADWPGDQELLELQCRTRADQRRIETAAALSNAVGKGKALESQELWNAALHVYEETLAGFPETASTLDAVIASARAGALAAVRKAQITEQEESIAACIEGGRLQEAEESLQNAENKFPNEPGFAALRELLAEERRRIARQATIHGYIDVVRRLIESHSFEEARKVASAAESECGSEPALTELQSSLVTAEREHDVAVVSALARIQLDFERSDWGSAIATAELSRQQFSKEARFLELLADARRNGERETRRQAVEHWSREIEALLNANSFDDAEILLQRVMIESPYEPDFNELKSRLERQRHEQARELVFHRVEVDASRLRGLREWNRARQLVAPYLNDSKMHPAAEAFLAELAQEEANYKFKMGQLQQRARACLDAKEYEAARVLLESAAAEFPEIPAFPLMLAEVHENSAAEQQARSLGETEQAVRSLLADGQFEKALPVAEEAVLQYPADKTLQNLRTRILGGIEENAAIAKMTGDVRRWIAAEDAAAADRALLEALRRFPGSIELEKLRADVDTARRAEWDRKSRKAALERAISRVDALLGQGRLAEAAAVLEALEHEFGNDAASELQRRLAVALKEAEDRRVAEEKLAQEAERQRREAEHRRVAEEKRIQEIERRRLNDIAIREAEQQRVFEENQKSPPTSVDHAMRRIQALLEGRRFDEALNAAIAALTEFPDEPSLSRLRVGAMAGLAEKAAIGGIAGEVRRLVAAGEAAEARRVLGDALRRYSGSPEIAELRNTVERAEQRQRDAQNGRRWAIPGIEKWWGKGSADRLSTPLSERESVATAESRATQRSSDTTAESPEAERPLSDPEDKKGGKKTRGGVR
jgi:serine/threonine protein kinase